MDADGKVVISSKTGLPKTTHGGRRPGAGKRKNPKQGITYLIQIRGDEEKKKIILENVSPEEREQALYEYAMRKLEPQQDQPEIPR